MEKIFPILQFVKKQWYVYVAADDGNNDHHHMFVLESTSGDPFGPFNLRNKLAPPSDFWAIDGTIVEFPDGKLYFIWSGWEGTDNVAQNLYIAPMSDPTVISGDRVLISKPTYDWETIGNPLVNEGPEALWHNGSLFIIYSASGSWTDDYCLGQLKWTGDDPLKETSWLKNPTPVFSKTDQVFGPGHASFVKSPDGTEDWIVYHAAKYKGAGWNRNIRIQKFDWNKDGTPNFGKPVDPGIPLEVPSGEK